MPTVADRVTNLEEIFARFLESTEEMRAEMQRETQADQARTEEWRREMQAARDRTDAQFLRTQEKAEQDRQVAERIRGQDRQEAERIREQDRQEAERIREQDRQEAAREWRAMRKQWAEISDSMGTLIEDMVTPNGARIAGEIFGDDPVIETSRRLLRRLPADRGQSMEIDYLAVGERHVMVVEAKRKLDPAKVREFLEKLERFAEFFPEHAGRKLTPVIASVMIEPSVVTFLNRAKVYGLAMGDETMELVNRGQF